MEVLLPWFDTGNRVLGFFVDDRTHKTEFIVDPASIVGAIVDYAERQNIDLIVIGSRGLSGFKKLLLGSTATGVVNYAHCPVLAVK